METLSDSFGDLGSENSRRLSVFRKISSTGKGSPASSVCRHCPKQWLPPSVRGGFEADTVAALPRSSSSELLRALHLLGSSCEICPIILGIWNWHDGPEYPGLPWARARGRPAEACLHSSLTDSSHGIHNLWLSFLDFYWDTEFLYSGSVDAFEEFTTGPSAATPVMYKTHLPWAQKFYDGGGVQNPVSDLSLFVYAYVQLSFCPLRLSCLLFLRSLSLFVFLALFLNQLCSLSFHLSLSFT